ncbi:MAG: HAMP domain-containing protein [Clostridia bacterium]|nr:HAMP domain-containing protein [Clostridia bacterium]MBQ3472032.1 HAMP domain-containing protein [Clostridia bacterium]MBQ9599877.1 HAMP domain-containing protein [Clostridia bacterium]
MFKSMRWKITLLFVLLVLATELLIGSFNIFGIANHYHRDFSDSIDAVFTPDTKNDLLAAANELPVPNTYNQGALTISDEDYYNVNMINDILAARAGTLGITANRYYCIIDAESGEVLKSSNGISKVETTTSISKAASGSEYKETGITKSYMDYSFPLTNGNTVRYIIYVYDNCSTQRAVTQNLISILLIALVISLIISAIVGMLISRSITIPIQQLAVQARKLADGDINALQKSDTRDEIGNLTNSLLYLAHTRKQSSDQALGEKIKVETILQNMTDGILAFDMKGRLLHFNPEAQKLLKRRYLDDINFDRFFKEINADIKLGDLLYMQSEGSVEREIKVANHYLHLNFATFKGENKAGGIIVIIHDVTKQEKLEQSRRDFVANVSHELRTPLTTIKSYSETLADMPDVDRETQVRFLDVIATESDRMARIISDLLTLSELDENQTFIKAPEQIDVRKMLETIVDRMDLQAKKKSQKLSYTPTNEVPVILGDRDVLERAIINVISNALKYTSEGGTIEVYSSKVYNDINIKVVDNGIGIAEDKLPHIFDRFYRADKARSRDTGGTGLGLAIAKQSIESSFNGKIKISSELHKGTEVTISIPVNE